MESTARPDSLREPASPGLLAIDGGPAVRSKMLPLSAPWTDAREADAAADAVRKGWLAGMGPATGQLERELTAVVGTSVLFVTSCTSALEAAVTLAGAGRGDEVICPSFTFVSTANAIVRSGARPVLVDIDPGTLNLDPDLVEHAITPRTKAVILVHYGGRACDMDAFLRLGERHGVRIIEDAAHAFGGRWHDRNLGTVGDFGCFSFHGTKDVVCGEGGGLVCRAPEDLRRAEVLREKGTNRSQFLRGEVDKYTWVDEGSSWVASDVLAAVLRVQVGRFPQILGRKRELAERLTASLEPIADRVTLPRVWEGIETTWHLYPVLVDPEVRDPLIAALRAEGIGATFHYVPLHSSPFGRTRLGYRAEDLPHTERVSASFVRLPLFAAMSDADLDDVATATLKVVERLLPRGVR